MRGASAETLQAVTERVEPLLSGPQAGPLGDELFSVTRALDSSAALRRALTDPNADGEAKAALVRRLLGGKVGDATLDVVSGLVRGRWSSTRDLADACEYLGVEATLAAADQQPGRLEQLEDDLFRFGRVAAADPGLQSALSDRNAPAQRKSSLVARLLHGKVGSQTLLLIAQAAAYPRGRTFDSLLEEMGRMAATRRNRSVAVVTSAVPLSQAQQDRLGAALDRIYGRPVHLNLDVDPALVGGIRVRIGDDIIDGSIVSKLSDANRRLTGR
ncbi:MAG: F0F1 ATP synthase subunit delta [Actinomycetales bacterium]